MLTQKRLYQINSSRILQTIRQKRGISRIAVAEELDLDRSTITKVVRYLEAIGLVRATGKFHGKPGSGRMATGLETNPEFGLILGIEAQTEFFRSVLVDVDGSIVEAGRMAYDKAVDSLENQIADIIAKASKTARARSLPLIGVGVGLAGIIDPYTGVILNSNPMNITGPVPLGERLMERTGIPVIVENDAKCCCWSEMAFRPSTRARNFIALLGEFRNVDVTKNKISGIAFGMGIVIRGSVLHGDNFTAGEFRSLRYDHERPNLSQFSISDEEALRLPSDGAVLTRVFAEVAYNVSLLVNSLDITKIVITGDFGKYADEITPMLRDAIGKNWLYDTPKNVDIDYSPDGENAVCMGAAGMFIQKLFSVPGMTDHLDEEVGFLLLEKILRAKGCADLEETG